MNYEKIARRHKLKVSVVEEEYEKYWKAVRKEMSFPTMMKILIPYFGSFVTSEGKIKHKIKNLNKQLLYFEEHGIGKRDEKIREDYIKQLESACHILEKFSIEDKEACEICHKWLKQTITVC